VSKSDNTEPFYAISGGLWARKDWASL